MNQCALGRQGLQIAWTLEGRSERGEPRTGFNPCRDLGRQPGDPTGSYAAPIREKTPDDISIDRRARQPGLRDNDADAPKLVVVAFRAHPRYRSAIRVVRWAQRYISKTAISTLQSRAR